MPKIVGYHYAPMPLDRKAAKQAPFAYQKTQSPATKNPGTGRLGGRGSKTSGGSMQGGGKRRPGSRTVR